MQDDGWIKREISSRSREYRENTGGIHYTVIFMARGLHEAPSLQETLQLKGLYQKNGR
jgi:hypothetical protein